MIAPDLGLDPGPGFSMRATRRSPPVGDTRSGLSIILLNSVGERRWRGAPTFCNNQSQIPHRPRPSAEQDRHAG